MKQERKKEMVIALMAVLSLAISVYVLATGGSWIGAALAPVVVIGGTVLSFKAAELFMRD